MKFEVDHKRGRIIINTSEREEIITPIGYVDDDPEPYRTNTHEVSDEDLMLTVIRAMLEPIYKSVDHNKPSMMNFIQASADAADANRRLYRKRKDETAVIAAVGQIDLFYRLLDLADALPYTDYDDGLCEDIKELTLAFIVFMPVDQIELENKDLFDEILDTYAVMRKKMQEKGFIPED